MISEDVVLTAREATLLDVRGSARLIVWGDIPDWMVVDGELARFLTLFDGKRTLRSVLELHGGNRAEALAIVERLVHRGILSHGTPSSNLQPGPIRPANVTFNLTNRCNLRWLAIFLAAGLLVYLALKLVKRHNDSRLNASGGPGLRTSLRSSSKSRSDSPRGSPARTRFEIAETGK